MKRLLLLLLIIAGAMCTSCESEYEERLQEGLYLKERLALIERSHHLLPLDRFNEEIQEIKNEIILLSKVSGNEELFLKQVFAN